MRTSLPLLLVLVMQQIPIWAQSPAPVTGAPPPGPISDQTTPAVPVPVTPERAAEDAKILEKLAKAQKDF